MVGKLYHKLWEAGSIENFKQAWLDCVECLYLVRKLGKVLHRDLSEGNRMILKLADGRVNGVLNDWDMARFVDADDSNMELDNEPRIGTPPFMAHDHLRMQCVPHYLRHDLEPFSYILVWAALHYNLKEGTRDRQPHPVVAGWMGSRDENRSSKLFLLMYDTDLVEEASATVKPEFAGVLTEWIGPLQFLFAGASLNHYKRLRTDPNTVSNPTVITPPMAGSIWRPLHLLDVEEGVLKGAFSFGGDLTFKKFMAALNVTPRTWGIPNFLDNADEF
ncbi:hypothetical protein FA13DRAFT_1795923 [Coprinellus micaceus]|uniref:Fungal-type protein kinase domain-containing protein n=1 Tax=Coprinellus micaceus TaxID=71717 RepID=A0A4Y7SWR1_COPMI|nr:hypothetical protein FA13DRAFT_1795923 [Coprinellus micaceus]